MHDSSPSTPSTPAIVHGPLVMDLDGFRVTVAGQDVTMTFREFLVLRELALHPYQVLDRTTLFAVLDSRTSDQHGAPTTTSLRAVDIHVSRIRRKLAKAGYDCIRTMRYVGYRFVPPGEAESSRDA